MYRWYQLNPRALGDIPSVIAVETHVKGDQVEIKDPSGSAPVQPWAVPSRVRDKDGSWLFTDLLKLSNGVALFVTTSVDPKGFVTFKGGRPVGDPEAQPDGTLYHFFEVTPGEVTPGIVVPMRVVLDKHGSVVTFGSSTPPGRRRRRGSCGLTRRRVAGGRGLPRRASRRRSPHHRRRSRWPT